MKKELTEKQIAFIKTFRELLINYGVSINWTCDECSDTYGLSNDHLVIEFEGEKDVDLCYPCIEADDLSELLKGNEGE